MGGGGDTPGDTHSCGENVDKLRKILLTSLCFGANYQNFVWKKELNVFVRKRRALPIGRAKQAHTPPPPPQP